MSDRTRFGDTDVLLKVEGAAKNYGATEALASSDLSIRRGSVHGVLGKNGAGKSTLVGIIAGTVSPDAGVVTYRGHDITHIDLVGRQHLGISLLNQHPELVEDLTVAENLVAPEYPKAFGFISWREVHRQAEQTLVEYELPLNPRTPCSDLGISDQRRLSIVKALTSGSELVLLDEPTASLTRSERAAFFEWIRRLNKRGKTFVFISHFTSEIRELCTDFTVLRDGRVVDAGTEPGRISAAALSQRVVGSAVDEFHRAPIVGADDLVELRGFATADVQPFDLTIKSGEIVGLAGLPGSGASSVARTLAGLEPLLGGSVRLGGTLVPRGGVARMVDSGIVYLTNDRQGEGLIPGFSVAESMVLGRWPRRRGIVDHLAIIRNFEQMRGKLAMAVRNHSQPVVELSGGNQQKVLFARLMGSEPRLMILNEPTHGIDVGVKEEVHRLMDELTQSGHAIILLAYDTEELVRVVDSVLVFRDGLAREKLTGSRLTLDHVLSAIEGDSAAAAPVEAR